MSTEFVTTSEACEILGVSKTVVKKLADEGQLETWKTPGGHRRIRLSSVQEALANNQGLGALEQKNVKNELNIMVIDDDASIQKFFSALCNSFDYKINLTQAMNGYEGLMKAGERANSMIFVDINMPHMNGYEAVSVLRKFDHTKDTTIIVITADDLTSLDRKALPSDVVLLSKPLNIDVIMQFINYEYKIKNLSE